MLIFSIDVGITNMGICFYNSETPSKLLFIDKISLSSSLKELRKHGEHSLIPKIKEMFFGENKISKMVDKSDIVIIEQQMKTKMKLIQYSIGSMCNAHNKQYAFISPNSVKNYFKTGASSRKLKGKKKNYAANKKAAITLATKLFPAYMRHIPHYKKDDVSDAIVQAVYYAQNRIK